MTDLIRVRTCCPACKSVEAKVLAEQSYADEGMKRFLVEHYEGRADPAPLAPYRYELVRCGACGFGYQRTIPGDALVNEIYEHWIPLSEKERLHESFALEDYEYLAEQVRFLIRHVGLPPHAVKVFDFGLGWAEWASMARAYGCDVYGAELSEVRIKHARDIGLKIITWDEIPSQSFHFINTEQVFEHLIEPLETLQHLARSLAPGGLLKVSVPDARIALQHLEKARSFSPLSAKDRVPVQPLEHVNCYEYATLVRMAERCGLKPVKPSLGKLYDSSSGWLHPKRAARQLLRPFYRHWYPRSTYAFFTRASS
jgi:SAM-dependent methyltransferase